ncbi:MAG: YebC/PmpR family DNA-binding transcriptional regulator [Planctomycetaceae bacterium]|nr:YebC/PmpR family DNA-binding transcriptional regulator [Planctomycetaceae bacterium]
MAGHSKWANIKHRKARQDDKRGRMWSKCARAIIVAARAGGGDPTMNLTLRYAIDEARAVNMPKDTIEKAVKKGSGELGGEDYEAVVYEGYGPSGVAVMIETLTDNRNRTAPELRKIFDKFGGNLGTSGCVAFMFSARGMILISKDAGDEESIMMAALEAGAEDVTDEGEFWQVLTDPAQLHVVSDALAANDIEVTSAERTMVPANTVECDSDIARKVLNLMDELDDHEDVQKAHANFDIPDEVFAALDA